jgi:two-component system LytT family sensor kinase
MDKNEQRICRYSSLLIALMVNSPKLLALREGGIIAHYWHFNALELVFQFLFNLTFCYLVFYLNLATNRGLYIFRNQRQWGTFYFFNGLILFAGILIGALIHRSLFKNAMAPPGSYLAGYAVRLCLSFTLTAIIIKLVLLLRDGKRAQLENEQLKTAYMATELEVLKEQMNPHFLFNSLSSLSAVIREDPDKAQKYVRELSNVFRYAITGSKVNLVTVDEELTVLRSFAQLISMRLEGAFKLNIVVDEPYLSYKLPHLSLQPLLENTVKHNAATLMKPLTVNGFKIMMHQEIEIIKSDEQFIVKLPLKA